jgi:2-iminobutanoate/2-iminopropanoate deaminase
MQREVVRAADAPAAVGAYSQAIALGGSGRLLFCSGQIPLDSRSGELVGETPGEQARQCLRNLEAVCVAAGGRLGDAVRTTIYLTDIGAFAEVDAAYAAFFAADPPARVAIGVAALPRGAQVEVDAVVALPG